MPGDTRRGRLLLPLCVFPLTMAHGNPVMLSRAHRPRSLEIISLWHTLVSQELAARYRGTLLGRVWPLLMPLLMLAVYGFVFGAVFRARWPGLTEDDHLGFTINLFAGLLVHGVLSETVGQAPGLMQAHSNFVRKMVFPLPVLVAVPLGTAIFHASFGFMLLVLVNGFAGGGWHLAAISAPVILLPYLVLLYGLALAFSALGVYIRDLGQITGTLVMLALFTGAVFFPRDMVPPALSGVVDYNPITWPIQALRDALLHGQWPSLAGWGLYVLAALLVLWVGWWIFAVLRKGFADVL